MKKKINLPEECKILGNTEEEIIQNICICAARYLTGVQRSDLETEEQQTRAIKEADAAYKYMHYVELKEYIEKNTIALS